MIDDLEFHDLTYNRFSGVEKCHKEDGTNCNLDIFAFFPWFSLFLQWNVAIFFKNKTCTLGYKRKAGTLNVHQFASKRLSIHHEILGKFEASLLPTTL